MTRPLAILALFICQQSLLADSSIKIHWEQLCSASAGHKLAISTADGKTLQGKCESTDATTLPPESRARQGSNLGARGHQTDHRKRLSSRSWQCLGIFPGRNPGHSLHCLAAECYCRAGRHRPGSCCVPLRARVRLV